MLQNLKTCFQLLSIQNKCVLKPQILTSQVNKVLDDFQNKKLYNTTRINFALETEEKKTDKFLKYNENFYPIQGPDEERRPAFICHLMKNIKYSPKKMWYIAGFIRGMSIEEAVKQLTFLPRKGSFIVKDVLLEAQKLAVEEHNVEFKSNLWVAESFVTKGVTIKGLRRHAKGRHGIIHYRHCNYYVRLEEGKPPKHYYLPYPKTGDEMLSDWMDRMRKRKVTNSL